MMRWSLLAISVAALGLLALGADSGWAADELVFGGAISQTGRFAELAGRQVNAIKMWADDVNAPEP